MSHDVPNYALVMGVPARQVGLICHCGVRLPESTRAKCEACSRTYLIDVPSRTRNPGQRCA